MIANTIQPRRRPGGGVGGVERVSNGGAARGEGVAVGELPAGGCGGKGGKVSSIAAAY